MSERVVILRVGVVDAHRDGKRPINDTIKRAGGANPEIERTA